MVKEKALSIIDVICENGDYGELNLDRRDIFIDLFDIYYEANDMSKAVKSLETAVEISIELDSNYDSDKTHTSLLLKGDKYGDIYFSHTENQSMLLLNRLKSKPYFDELLSVSDIKKLINRLEKYAKVL